MNLPEVTTFGSSDRAYLANVRDGTFQLGGFFDGSTGAIDRTLVPLLASSTTPTFTYGPEGDTIGRRAYLLAGHVDSYSVTTPAEGAVAIEASVQASNGWRGGVWLHAHGAETSTGAFTSVADASTAGTTSGGVAHLHVTAISTASTSAATIKVQHSSAGVSWTDLISFTASTDTNVQRSTVAGTVKQEVRGIITAFTGTTSKSVTFGLAFARNPS